MDRRAGIPADYAGRRRIAVAGMVAALLLGPGAAAADQTQLRLLVRNGLAQHGISADTSRLNTSELAQLHLKLGEPRRDETGFERRNRLIFILRRAEARIAAGAAQ